jgi:hypothetical protein
VRGALVLRGAWLRGASVLRGEGFVASLLLDASQAFCELVIVVLRVFAVLPWDSSSSAWVWVCSIAQSKLCRTIFVSQASSSLACES